MGERDTARREAEDARARLSVLASELGRRANPEYAKEHARELLAEKKTEWKEHARELIAEKRTALKDGAKERVMRTTSDWRMVAQKNPRGAGTVGALLGASLGAFVARKLLQREAIRFERTEYWDGRGEVGGGVGYATAGAQTVERGVVPAPAVSYRGEDFVGYRGESIYAQEGFEGEEHSAKEKAREALSSAKEKASEALSSAREKAGEALHSAKEKASHTVDSARERASMGADSTRERMGRVREHIPSRDQVREQAVHARDVAKRTAHERPVLLGLGAVAFGVLAASFLPLSNRERRALAPARERTRETLEHLGDKAEAKLSGHPVQGEQRGDGDISGGSFNAGTGFTADMGGDVSGGTFRAGSSDIGGGASVGANIGYGAGKDAGAGASGGYGADTGFSGASFREGESGPTVIARPDERPRDTGDNASSEFDASKRSSSDTEDTGNIEPSQGPDFTRH